MIRKLLFNKKGIAIEMAVITMLVIFGLCIVLLTIAELTAYSRKRMMVSDTERIIVDTIADDYLASCYNNSTFYVSRYSEGNYLPKEYRMSSGNRLLIVYKKSSSAPKLALEVAGQGAGCKVVLWSRAESYVRTHYVLDDEQGLADIADQQEETPLP